MPRLLPVLVALVSLSTATAADLVLGPESPMTPPSTTPAPFEQHLAGVASNGRDTLAIWLDRRATVPSVGYVYGAVPLYTTRLDEAGRPANPFGRKLIDKAITAAVVRTSTGYVVLWSSEAETDFMPVDDDGNPLATPRRLTDGVIIGAASNGRTIFVIRGSFSNPQFATIFSTDGTQLANTALDATNHYPPSMRPFVMPDGSYGFVPQTWTCPGKVPCVVEPTLNIVTESGNLQTRPLGPVEQATQSSAAVGGGRLMLAWISDSVTQSPFRTVSYRLFDSSGAPITDRKVVASATQGASISGAYAPSVGWDGHEFLVAWQWPTSTEQSGEIDAVRVTPLGVPLDSSPVVLWNTLGNPPWFASSDSGQLVLWDTAISGSSDIAVRSVPSFDAIASAPTRIIPESAALQSDVQIAAIGGSRMAVWREGEPTTAIIAATAAGTPIVISPGDTAQDAPAIAASANQYLVVWREVTSSPTPYRIVGKRLRPDGTILDRDPIVIASSANDAYFSNAYSLAVASDGTDFLVLWPAPLDRLDAARVSAAGKLLDPAPIEIAPGAFPSTVGTPGSPRAIWNGSKYVIAWTADPSCKVCLSPSAPYSNVVTATLSRDAKVLDAKIVWTGTYAARVALARGPAGLMLAWGITMRNPSCIETIALTTDGALAGSQHEVYCSSAASVLTPPTLDAAWDGGGSFVIAWTDVSAGAKVKALRVAGDGSRRDLAPFDVSPAVTQSYEPALASTPDGIIVAYGRIADEPQYGGVGRLFVRTLAPTAPVFRRRVTR